VSVQTAKMMLKFRSTPVANEMPRNAKDRNRVSADDLRAGRAFKGLVANFGIKHAESWGNCLALAKCRGMTCFPSPSDVEHAK
jgi:hypothetical protein